VVRPVSSGTAGREVRLDDHLAGPFASGQVRILSNRSDGNEVMVAAGTARDRRVAWVIRRYGALGSGVDREQRVDAGEFGDPVQRPAGPDRESHLSASGGGFAVGPEQMPDG
jgi:hypothetical protein